jgi:PPOX class probable F420-dependent enzyme
MPQASRQLTGASILGRELVHELLEARAIGVLATLDLEFVIHAVPMWLCPDEDSVLLATGALSRKVRNLERDPRATLVVHDSRPGFEVCGVSLSGRVEIVRGDAARPLVERVHRRYVAEGSEDDAAVGDFLASDDVALRFRPEHAWTWDERSSEASRALRASGGALPLSPTEPRPG